VSRGPEYERMAELLTRAVVLLAVAHELGISVTNLRRIKSQGIKRYDYELAKETKPCA
jgi:hypothetical protein